ncbi:MAG TPA: hypothetical protein PKD00_03150 [Burkholderiales bacterium]|nr:hypothetical protein [Burkholderiales bacterium]
MPDVAKTITPIFDKHIRESKIVEQQLLIYMNSNDFKKLELKHLKERITQIESELEN